MGAGKVAYLIGDTSHAEVSKLIAALQNANIEVKLASTSDRFDTVLLCLTSADLSREVWKVLDVNQNARVLPVLFDGGKLPAIYADIKPANFAKDPVKGLSDLNAAIDRFC